MKSLDPDKIQHILFPATRYSLPFDQKLPMRIESARDLKSQLLTEVVLPFSRAAVARSGADATALRVPALARALADSSTFAVGATPLPRISDVHRSVALGIAKRGRQYRLAVRVQRQALLDSPLLEHIVHEARKEVDVQFIGRVEKRTELGDDALEGEKSIPRKSTPRRKKGKLVFVGAQAMTPPWQRQNSRPLLIGVSVGHIRVTAGTLGAFVQRGRRTFMLSNNHVLANENRGTRGDSVLQRAVADGGRDPDDRIGSLRHFVRLKKSGTNLVDAALADFEETNDYDPSLLRGLTGKDRRLVGVGPEFLDEGETVYKLGRTTGATVGRVTAFDIDNVVVSYGIGNLRFDGQVEVEGTGSQAFSDGGDSGSLIVNDRMEAVGLLFAGGDVGGSNGRGLTYANPISRVLQDLSAKLLS